MDCDRCVYKSRRYPNRCSLLTNKDVSWDCTTTPEDFKQILVEQIEYYDMKHKASRNNIDQTIYSRERTECQKLLSQLKGV